MESGESRGTRGRVLLVDDEPQSRDAMRAILRHAGFEVDEAQNAREAITRLDAAGTPPVCILVDWGNDGGGSAVVQYVRARQMPTAVVAVTGDDERHIAEIRALRPHGVFRKPVDAEAVVAMVNRFVPRTAERDETPRPRRA